jgi:hypothetical protein
MGSGTVPPSLEDVRDQLKRTFKRRIPPGSEIAAAAVLKAVAGHESDAAWIRQNVSNLVEQVQLDAYATYQAAEEVAGRRALADTFLPLIGEHATAAQMVDILGQYFTALDRFFLGLTQGRRQRAGQAFEILIRDVLVRLQYPFSAQALISNSQPDFILPSLEHFRKNPPDAIIFTLKRSLRERWRQIVTEGTRGLGFFLATIDEKIAARDLAAMLESRIRIVVPARIKSVRPAYETAVNVITFEQFFQYHLDPAMERWRAAGVVP